LEWGEAHPEDLTSLTSLTSLTAVEGTGEVKRECEEMSNDGKPRRGGREKKGGGKGSNRGGGGGGGRAKGAAIVENWYYFDPSGTEQGPFGGKEMEAWRRSGAFKEVPDMIIRKAGQEDYMVLSEYLESHADGFLTGKSASKNGVRKGGGKGGGGGGGGGKGGGDGGGKGGGSKNNREKKPETAWQDGNPGKREKPKGKGKSGQEEHARIPAPKSKDHGNVGSSAGNPHRGSKNSRLNSRLEEKP